MGQVVGSVCFLLTYSATRHPCASVGASAVVEYRTRNFHVASSNLNRVICKRPWASCMLTYCVLRPTQPPTLSGMGNECVCVCVVGGARVCARSQSSSRRLWWLCSHFRQLQLGLSITRRWPGHGTWDAVLAVLPSPVSWLQALVSFCVC